MAYDVQPSGDMIIYQGDSVELNINGIPTDQNYKVYFAVQDEERNPIGQEILVESNYSDTVTIKLVGNYTDLFTVPEDVKSQKYYYGVKLCSDGDNTEDTLLLGNTAIGSLNVITVFPRKVKGI